MNAPTFDELKQLFPGHHASVLTDYAGIVEQIPLSPAANQQLSWAATISVAVGITLAELTEHLLPDPVRRHILQSSSKLFHEAATMTNTPKRILIADKRFLILEDKDVIFDLRSFQEIDPAQFHCPCSSVALDVTAITAAVVAALNQVRHGSHKTDAAQVAV